MLCPLYLYYSVSICISNAYNSLSLLLARPIFISKQNKLLQAPAKHCQNGNRRSHLLSEQPLRVGSDLITLVLVVCDLGIHIDADVSMRSHVMNTMSACFAVLRRLRGIRRSVSRTVFQSLVSCLVLLRLDYYNAVLAGIPLDLARRLQSVINAAARLVFASSKCDHITPLLRQLHWLKSSWGID